MPASKLWIIKFPSCTTLSNTTPNLSPYLETCVQRFADRQMLIRKDVDLLMDALRVKSRILEGLNKRVSDHRQEDATQFKSFQEESWSRWEERLKRLQNWQVQTAELGRISGRAEEIRKVLIFFDRAKQLSDRYASRLEVQADRLQKKLSILTTAVGAWTDRLALEEKELQDFVERQAKKGTEVLVSSARKRPHQEFVFTEREKEAELARIFKAIRVSSHHVLERSARLEKWANERALVQPAYFEIPRKQLVDVWQSIARRFCKIRDTTLEQALIFEEGRQRLRRLYDIVQKMRVVQETRPQPEKKKKPLLQRLFHNEH